jgi:hypothetical protein
LASGNIKLESWCEQVLIGYCFFNNLVVVFFEKEFGDYIVYQHQKKIGGCGVIQKIG